MIHYQNKKIKNLQEQLEQIMERRQINSEKALSFKEIN